MAKYTVYKTTNLINGKIYVGQHACSCEECSYMGSGNAISRAIKKYGKENFKKEILFEFDNVDEMNQKEAEIVNEEFVSRSDTYNLMTGGHSGRPGPSALVNMSIAQKISHRKLNRKKLSNKDILKLCPKTGKIIARYKYASDAIDTMVKSSSNIAKAAKSKIYAYGFLWALDGDVINDEVIIKSRKAYSKWNEKREIRKLSSKEIQDKRLSSLLDANRMKWRKRQQNKDVLKIDANTGDIVERYRYMIDCVNHEVKSACKAFHGGVIKGGIRYGYKWRLAD